MQSGYARYAFAQPTARTWRERAISASLSAAILFLLGLLLFTLGVPPVIAPAVEAPLLTEFVVLPRMPAPERRAQAEPDVPRRTVSGGSPRPAGPPDAVRHPAAARGAPPDPPTDPPLKLTEVPLVPPLPLPLPSIDDGTARAGRGTADGAGSLGSGNQGLGGTGSGRGRRAGDGDGAAPTIVPPRWVFIPTERDLAPFVPAAARRARASGTVYLACQVMKSRRLHNCRILSEQPSDMGFGSASLAASRNFRVYPEIRDGKAVNNVWVGFPIDWTFKP
ncbi:TonB family protein [Sphingomonas sp. SFZ2018-12]|uniref:TonB family protein n=1 Tax=Sphingomonas sp. SFZ2018-12 TaxID=2683197 RepID=UPI001F117FEF|nr:TonB family protein [Sphingomonas sp. SFZ2018-12]MCH4893581.1 TonB family protein [Sphingomonas sp. SFZ2018-12]